MPGPTVVSALVLAAGRGERLRPLTYTTPKPLLPILDHPLLDLIVSQLLDSGVSRIGINASHLSHQITAFARDHGHQDGLSLDVRVERSPSGPAGALRVYEDVVRTSDVTVVVSGDALIDLDVGRLVRRHLDSGAALTVVTKPMMHGSQFGVVDVDNHGRVVAWREKPAVAADEVHTVSCGVYALAPEAMDVLGTGAVVDFGPDLALPLLVRGDLVTSIPITTFWADIGSLEALRVANIAALCGDTGIGRLGAVAAEGIARCRDAVSTTVVTRGPVFLGHEARVEAGAIVVGPAVIGACSLVACGARVERSVLLPGSRLAAGSVVADRVVSPTLR